jgi:hypothetical protein
VQPFKQAAVLAKAAEEEKGRPRSHTIVVVRLSTDPPSGRSYAGSCCAGRKVCMKATKAVTPAGVAVIEGQNVELLVISDSHALPLLDANRHANRPLQQRREAQHPLHSEDCPDPMA